MGLAQQVAVGKARIKAFEARLERLRDEAPMTAEPPAESEAPAESSSSKGGASSSDEEESR